PAYDLPLPHETSTSTAGAFSGHSADVAATVLDFDRGSRVRRLVRLGETGERIGGDRHDEVTHGDVEVGPRRHEVEGDRDKPHGLDVAPDHRPAGEDRDPDQHLHDAGDVHEGR